MKKFAILLFLLSSIYSSANIVPQSTETGKLYFSLQHLEENKWGIFVVPDNSIAPSDRVKTGSGQVTIKAPAGFTYFSFENHAGTWVENAKVTSPIEAASTSYISFGFVHDQPKIKLIANEKTLLFSFRTDDIYIGTFSLFNNGNDPFETPNSYGTNPGNDLGMLDIDSNKQLVHYSYASNIIDPATELFAKNNNQYNYYGRALMVSKEENDHAAPKE